MVELSSLLEGAPPIQISALSSSLSHEIRNPLSSVKMAVQTVARNTGLSDRDQRRLRIANREIRTIERMLWLLSEYGRDSLPALEATTLRVLLQEAASMVEPELTERRVQLEIIEDETPPRVRADSGRLRGVLSQLLLNVAVGHPEGATIPVRLRRAGAQGQLILVDPSSALPAEERSTLFQPFGSRLARGAGLSLAALHQVMTSLGGSIAAEGSESPGTTFTRPFSGASKRPGSGSRSRQFR
jgi:signal transduction histidine kinase